MNILLTVDPSAPDTTWNIMEFLTLNAKFVGYQKFPLLCLICPGQESWRLAGPRNVDAGRRKWLIKCVTLGLLKNEPGCRSKKKK